MRYRHRVSGLLILLFAITYIDRVCISVAGPACRRTCTSIPSAGAG